MENKNGFRLTELLFILVFLSACSPGLQTEVESNGMSIPPTEGNGSAPTLEATTITGFQPKGVLVNSGNETSLLHYNTSGQLVQEIETPGIMNADPTNVHLAGGITSGDGTVPLIYLSWQPEQALIVNSNGVTNSLRKTTSFFALAGAAGQPSLAFSEVAYDDNVPHSYLYAGNLDNITTVSPFYDLKDEYTQMALIPVAVKASASDPQGVWYTHSAWGIGGVDLIFNITRGLYYYDLTSGENIQYLGLERNFQGISPDLKLVGSIAFDSEGDLSLTVTDLETYQIMRFPLKASSNRGGGYAIFSADNQYIAFLEASGSYMDEPSSYQSVVRIANLASGSVEFEIEDTSIAQYINSSKISFMKPVGWLDNQSLLIETRTEDWGQVSLVRFNLYDKSLSVFCEGSFAGFVYP